MTALWLVSCPTRLSSSWRWQPQKDSIEKRPDWEKTRLRKDPIEKRQDWEKTRLRKDQIEKRQDWEKTRLRKDQIEKRPDWEKTRLRNLEIEWRKVWDHTDEQIKKSLVLVKIGKPSWSKQWIIKVWAVKMVRSSDSEQWIIKEWAVCQKIWSVVPSKKVIYSRANSFIF